MHSRSCASKKGSSIMSQEEALNVLVQAARISQSKGVFNLDEAALVAQAVNAFVESEPEAESEAESEVEPEVELTAEAVNA